MFFNQHKLIRKTNAHKELSKKKTKKKHDND